ncbi:MAG TPA: hypothetical protein VMW50_13160 [Dehalococcoidia bacterium]|nr:hypothetical protein [Dehalococcoidia bacterium]
MIVNRKELGNIICYYPRGQKRPITRLHCRSCFQMGFAILSNNFCGKDDVMFSETICGSCTISGCTYSNFDEVNDEK